MSSKPGPEETLSSKEEPDWVSLGLDPSLSTQFCLACQLQCLDLGKQSADEYTRELRWYQCSGCGRQFSIITGPARMPELTSELPECDYHYHEQKRGKKRIRK